MSKIMVDYEPGSDTLIVYDSEHIATIPAKAKPALLAALLEDAGAVKVSGEWMEEGCGSERIYEGIDIRTVPEGELDRFLKAERRQFWLLPIPEDTP